ncbi:MAG: DUF3224 domain-containing protein [Acidimicrobiaceae bacterium]|nr:DUF3224 domain-containing protein [Acidimicrobiaceae bacterium]
MNSARGTFDVAFQERPAELGGAVGRLEFTKRFHGDITGTGAGLMLSCGDPGVGEAGYVAMETVHGHLGVRQGSFALLQFGLMHDGSQTLHYEVVPGSGQGGLEGIGGTFHLKVEADGTHSYELEYELGSLTDTP